MAYENESDGEANVWTDGEIISDGSSYVGALPGVNAINTRTLAHRSASVCTPVWHRSRIRGVETEKQVFGYDAFVRNRR